MAEDEDTCTWGEAVELGYLANRRQPVPCPPEKGKGAKRRHGILVRLAHRGLAELAWIDGQPCFSVTARGQVALARAKLAFNEDIAASQERNAARARAWRAQEAARSPEERLASFFANGLALAAEIEAMQASLRRSAAEVAAAVPGATAEGLLQELDLRHSERKDAPASKRA